MPPHGRCSENKTPRIGESLKWTAGANWPSFFVFSKPLTSGHTVTQDLGFHQKHTPGNAVSLDGSVPLLLPAENTDRNRFCGSSSVAMRSACEPPTDVMPIAIAPAPADSFDEAASHRAQCSLSVTASVIAGWAGSNAPYGLAGKAEKAAHSYYGRLWHGGGTPCVTTAFCGHSER